MFQQRLSSRVVPASSRVQCDGALPMRGSRPSGHDCIRSAIRSLEVETVAKPSDAQTPIAKVSLLSVSNSLQQPSRGFTGLFLCSFLWGTYGPALKLIYAEEHPLDPATLTAVRGLIAAASLLGADAVSKHWRRQRRSREEPFSSAPPTLSMPSSTLQPSPAGDVDDDSRGRPGFPSTSEAPTDWLMVAVSGSVIFAGLELGLYNFIGTSMEAVGLQITSATRAGFITQSCAVITPALAYLGGQRLPPRVWFAVAMGLLGSCLVVFDGMSFPSSDPALIQAAENPEELRGVVLLFVSCFFYSMAVIRLGEYAPRFGSMELATSKKISFCIAVVAYCFIFEQRQHPGLTALPMEEQLDLLGVSGRSLPSWALIAYSALGPGAFATWLETEGQATIPATQAQLIYSLAPIWSALIAQLLCLPGEGMGPLSWAGGSAVLAASILAVQGQGSGGDERRVSDAAE